VHATVLLPPGVDEWNVLARFKAAFDDYRRKEHRPELADEALRWLEAHASTAQLKPVVIHNHPSRKAAKSTDHMADLLRWRGVNDLVIGFEGAPGHQGAKAIGSYRYAVSTADRWDPAAAGVGDLWDTLLGKGQDVWAALAASDFHNTNPKDLKDFWPGQFSETWVYVPERSAAGVLRALRAGSFFAAHGHIAREVTFTAEADGLPRPAHAGESVRLRASTSVRVGLSCVVPERTGGANPTGLTPWN
jgi:hypothetical protein